MELRAALVGRPNVGKSSLFNSILMRSRKRDAERVGMRQNPRAIVADYDGVTRDIIYGEIPLPHGKIILSDSPGQMLDNDALHKLMEEKALESSDSADIILLVCDGQVGINALDREIIQRIRTSGQECLLLVNKMDKKLSDSGDFYALGFPVMTISATKGFGIKELLQLLADKIPQAAAGNESKDDQNKDAASTDDKSDDKNKDADSQDIKEITDSTLAAPDLAATAEQGQETLEPLAEPQLASDAEQVMPAAADTDALEDPRNRPSTLALLGCPNAGKSTLANIFLKEQKQLVHHLPGSTRDSVFHPMQFSGEEWQLVDTAGIRRKSRIKEDLEQQSFSSALQALRLADLAVYVVDSEHGMRHQDLALLRLATRHGKGLVVAINKSDTLDQQETKDMKGLLEWELAFMDFAPVHFISAKNNKGIRPLVKSILATRDSLAYEGKTSILNRYLESFIRKNPPPMRENKRSSLRYVNQVASHPPKLVIYGKRVDHLPDSYKKFLQNSFSHAMELIGSPLIINYQNDVNPYSGRGNPRKSRRG